MHFGFALELSDIDLWNIDLLDTHLDLLSPDKYTDIPSKYFVCLHKIFRTSSRHVLKTSSRHVFKTSSRHVFKTSSTHVSKTFSGHVFKTSSRHVFKTSLRHVFKMSSRRLGRRKIVTLKTCWRHLQDMFAGIMQCEYTESYSSTLLGWCLGVCWEVWVRKICWWNLNNEFFNKSSIKPFKIISTFSL